MLNLVQILYKMDTYQGVFSLDAIIQVDIRSRERFTYMKWG
jgi:hypothetical protein